MDFLWQLKLSRGLFFHSIINVVYYISYIVPSLHFKNKPHLKRTIKWINLSSVTKKKDRIQLLNQKWKWGHHYQFYRNEKHCKSTRNNCTPIIGWPRWNGQIPKSTQSRRLDNKEWKIWINLQLVWDWIYNQRPLNQGEPWTRCFPVDSTNHAQRTSASASQILPKRLERKGHF